MGIAAGLVVAPLSLRAIGGLLFDVSPNDPAPYVAVTIVLALVGATACYVPASRAAHSDPLRVLFATTEALSMNTRWSPGFSRTRSTPLQVRLKGGHYRGP